MKGLRIVLLVGVSAAVAWAGEPARVDSRGDPLPEGAVARLGSLRLRDECPEGLSFSSDGRLLANLFGGRQRGIRIWSVETGKDVLAIPIDPVGPHQFAFVPGRNVVAWVCGTGMAGLHDIDARREIWRVRAPVARATARIAISPKGDMAALAGARGVELRDLATGKQVRQLVQWSEDLICVAYCPDGTRLAVGTGSPAHGKNFVWVFDAATGQELGKHALGKEAPRCLAYSPDGTVLAVGTWGEAGPDGRGVLLMEPATGKAVGRVAFAGEVVEHVAWFPDGSKIAGAGRTPDIHVWNVADGKVVHRLSGQGLNPSGLAVSPDGALLAAAICNSIRLWDMPAARERFADCGHSGFIQALAVSPDGRLAATGGTDGTIRLWELPAGREVRRLTGYEGWVTGLAFSPNGTSLAASSHDRTVRLWDVSTGQELQCLTSQHQWGRLSFDAGGQRVLGTVNRLGAFCWNIADGKQVPTGLGRDAQIRYEALCPGGRLAAGPIEPLSLMLSSIADPPKPFVVAEVATGRAVLRLEAGRVSGRPCRFAPQGDAIALYGSDGLCLIEISSGKELLRIPFSACPSAAAFSADGRLLAVSERDHSISVLDARTCRRLVAFHGHRAHVGLLEFTADRSLLVSAGGDGSAVVWSLAGVTPEPLAPAGAGMEALWEDLAAEDAAKAYQAMWALVGRGEPAVEMIAERLKPRPCDEQRVKDLIRQLGDNAYDVRAKAMEELGKLADAAEAVLRRAHQDAADAEVKQRLGQLLESIDGPVLTTSGLLRQSRAVGVLARIGSVRARAALEALLRQGPSRTIRDRTQMAIEHMEFVGEGK